MLPKRIKEENVVGLLCLVSGESIQKYDNPPTSVTVARSKDYGFVGATERRATVLETMQSEMQEHLIEILLTKGNKPRTHIKNKRRERRRVQCYIKGRACGQV
jgi:hypothetical protein